MWKIFRRHREINRGVLAVTRGEAQARCLVRDDLADACCSLPRHRCEEWNMLRYYDLNPRHIR